MKRAFMVVCVLAMLMSMAACEGGGAASASGTPGVAAPKDSKDASAAEGAQRQQAYKRLAIVCAPVADADPAYKTVILDEVKRNVPSRLGWLEKADCLHDVEVDASSGVPLPVGSSMAAEYDAVAVLLYRYGGGRVLLEIHMIDAATSGEIWHQTLNTRDHDTRTRLSRHGFWTPTTIKVGFYAHD